MLETTGVVLFLDDMRDPGKEIPHRFRSNPVRIARSVREFGEILKGVGDGVCHACLDFDLEFSHYADPDCIRRLATDCFGGTGLEAARMLIRSGFRPSVSIHTSNIVGGSMMAEELADAGFDVEWMGVSH